MSTDLEKHDEYLKALGRLREQAASHQSALALVEQAPQVGFDEIIPQVGATLERFVSKFAQNGINIRYTDPKAPLWIDSSHFYSGTPSKIVYFSLTPAHHEAPLAKPKIAHKPSLLDLYEVTKLQPNELLRLSLELRFDPLRTIEAKIQSWDQQKDSVLSQIGHRRVFSTSDGLSMQTIDVKYIGQDPETFADEVFKALLVSDPNIITRYYGLTGNRLAALPDAA